MGRVIERVIVDGIGFDPLDQAEIHRRIQQAVRKPRPKSFVYIKPYVEFFDPQRPAAVTRLIKTADLVVADGVSVQWAASYLDDGCKGIGHLVWSLRRGVRSPDWLNRIIPQRGAGVDTTRGLLQLAEAQQWRIGILGGPADRTQTVQQAIKQRFPQLKEVAVWPGYFSAAEESRLIKAIAASQLDILFVAMGYPKQEDFIARHPKGLAKVLIGEGGTFDYDQMGGTIKRAPSRWRRLGLEWLWRLMRQPRRLGRQLIIPWFIWRIYKLNIQNLRAQNRSAA